MQEALDSGAETEESAVAPAQPEVEVDETDSPERYEAVPVERSVVVDELDAHEDGLVVSEETASAQEDDDEPQADDSDSDSDSEAVRGDEPPKKFRGRAWYKELTARAEAAEQRVMEAEARGQQAINSLREEFGAQQQKQEQADAIAERPWIAKGADQPQTESFETIEEWAEANHDWRAAQDAPDQVVEAIPWEDTPNAQGITPKEQLRNDKISLNKEGVERFGQDYIANVVENAQAPFDNYMISFVVANTDDPAALFNYYGTNLDEAMKVRVLLDQGNVNQAIRTVAKAEGFLTTSGDRADTAGRTDSGVDTDDRVPSTPSTRRVSQAPDPITPIRGGGNNRSPGVDPERESTSDYLARRLKESQAVM